MLKDLQVALKKLEPFIRNGEHLQTGKAFKWFDNLRSRELQANWLLCVVGNPWTSNEIQTANLDSEPKALPHAFQPTRQEEQSNHNC